MDGSDVYVGPFHIDLKTVTHEIKPRKARVERVAPISKGSTASMVAKRCPREPKRLCLRAGEGVDVSHDAVAPVFTDVIAPNTNSIDLV